MKIALLASALLCGATLAQAASSKVTFSVDMSTQIAAATFTPGTDSVSANGSFNGYASFNLVRAGTSSIYTNTVDDTTDANGGKIEYKFVINGSGWENTANGQNRAAHLPATSGASLVLPTAYYGDSGPITPDAVKFQVDMAQQINLGAFDPNNPGHLVYARGAFNGWGTSQLTNDPTILRTNQFGLVSSNVYTGTFDVATSPGAVMNYKFYYYNGGDQWENPASVNLDGTGNRYSPNAAQTLPIVYFSDSPYAPVATNAVTFQVDMSAKILTGAFVPGTTPIDVRGSFNGWSGGTNPLTNNPAAPNTNVYSTVITIIDGVGSVEAYKFTYDSGGTQWESPDPARGPTSGPNDYNRVFNLPNASSTVLPLVTFSDQSLNDLLLNDTPVSFQVDMNGAVGTDAHAFNSGSDRVFINGQFAGWYAWYGGVNPAPAPPGYELFETSAGSGIYSNTIIVPKGTAVAFEYKYGIGEDGAPGAYDVEAGFAQNHYRVVRSTALNPYPMPIDKFGTQYHEPLFGDLKVGAKSGSTVPVTWLGRPGLHLQSRASLTSGSWVDALNTDGTNWSSGFNSTNGFVSRTNWPATGTGFFRLIKPN